MIRRGPSPKRYYILSYEIIEKDLSAEALGVLVYVLSRPDNWQIYPSQLAKKFHCGRDKMTRILKEIRALGYASFKQLRDDSGHLAGAEWTFSELPESDNQDAAETHTDQPVPENPTPVTGNRSPHPEKPQPVKPHPVNPHLLITDNKLSTEKELITEEGDKPPKKKRKRFVPPSLQEVIDYKNERNSLIDPNRFVDFYMSKDWMVGKNKMKDWKAAFRNWESRDGGNHGNQQVNQPSDKPRSPADRFRAIRAAERSNGSVVGEDAGELRPQVGGLIRDDPSGRVAYSASGNNSPDD